RRAKHQAPKPKLQRSSKSQNRKPQNRCRGKRRAGRFLSLELGASLELGDWNLELVAWALSFSTIEMPLGWPRARLSACLFGQMTLKVSPMTALTRRMFTLSNLSLMIVMLITAAVYWRVLAADFVYWGGGLGIYGNPNLTGISPET